jgi:hypothetical protein
MKSIVNKTLTSNEKISKILLTNPTVESEFVNDPDFLIHGKPYEVRVISILFEEYKYKRLSHDEYVSILLQILDMPSDYEKLNLFEKFRLFNLHLYMDLLRADKEFCKYAIFDDPL